MLGLILSKNDSIFYNSTERKPFKNKYPMVLLVEGSVKVNCMKTFAEHKAMNYK